MRNYLDKKHFTKAERVFGRLLQELKIPFKTKIKINNLEIDFLIGRYAIEIDGHEQVGKKNHLLAEAGYIPIHFTNQEIIKGRDKIKNKLNEYNKFPRRSIKFR